MSVVMRLCITTGVMCWWCWCVCLGGLAPTRNLAEGTKTSRADPGRNNNSPSAHYHRLQGAAPRTTTCPPYHPEAHAGLLHAHTLTHTCSFTLSHTRTYRYSQFHADPPPRSHTLRLPHSLIHTHTHTHTENKYFDTHSHTRTNMNTLFFSLAYTHTYTLNIFTHILTLTHKHTFSLTYTRTHTHYINQTFRHILTHKHEYIIFLSHTHTLIH